MQQHSHVADETAPTTPRGNNHEADVATSAATKLMMAKLITAARTISQVKVEEKLKGNLFVDLRVDNFEVRRPGTATCLMNSCCEMI